MLGAHDDRRGRRATRRRSARRRSRRTRPSPGPRRRASASAAITFADEPVVESVSSASPGAPVGDHLAREDRLDADVVGDRGQDRRVLGEVQRRAGPRARRSATTSIASVAEPPLPSASSRAAANDAAAALQHARVLAQRLLAQRADLRRLPRSSAARPRAPRRGRSLAAVEERIEEADAAPAPTARAARGARRTRARAPRARGRASRPAPGGRTGRPSAATKRLVEHASRRRSLKTTTMSSGSALELRARRSSAAPAPAARACRRSPGGRTRPRRGARRTRSPTRQQPPAAQEALRHLVAQRAPAARPRRRRTRGSRASAPAVTPPPGGAPGSAASQSRNASTPSPVRALTSIVATPGCTASRCCAPLVEVEVEVRQQVDLVEHDELAGAEHQRVLERLVLALGDRGDHHPRVLADPELGRADEVADVLDHQQVDRRPAGSTAARERTMFASRWHSPPKPGAGVQLRRPARAARRAGRRRACPARRPRARPRGRRRGRAARAPAAPSCPRRARP